MGGQMSHQTSSKRTWGGERKDHYRVVTDQIIEETDTHADEREDDSDIYDPPADWAKDQRRCPMKQPHKIDATVLNDMAPIRVASAETADGTQHKFLYAAVGKAEFRVCRRYTAEPGSSQTCVHEGTDLAEAIRIYNGMG